MSGSINMQTLAFAFLAATTIGGLAWVFLYPLLSGEKKAEQRRASFSRTEPVTRQAEKTQRSRREQVEGSIKDLEKRSAKSVPLSVRIAQAGLTWSTRRFYITCAILGVSMLLMIVVLNVGLWPALGMGFAAGCGLPLWMLKFLKNRREAKFLAGFPDAVDIIVTVSSTGVAVPTIDARLATQIGLRPDAKRVPLFGLGCVAGTAGMARASNTPLRIAAADQVRMMFEYTLRLMAYQARR